MAKLPITIPELVTRFGPTLNRIPATGWNADVEPDKLVKTHCCFCGQQCGIQLKVRDNRVIGFEPWEDFPFNQGRLCPKGVKRYMQDEHPDRLKAPMMRKPGAGFVPASCMVSAAAASKKIFGIDRSANPWSDIPLAEAILVAGANVAECAPITTNYLWQARENGSKLIVMDPRMTPIARNADLYIPVRSGGDIGVFNGMLHVMIERGWINREFIAQHTTGWEQVEEVVRKYTPEYASKIAGVPASMIVKAAEIWGPARSSFLLHARGIEHHSKGVQNCMAAINLVVATGRIGREGCGYAMITGQGNGQGGREQGQKCDQLPGGRDIENPEHRKYIAGVWGVPEESIPHKGLSMVPIIEAIHEGKIKGLMAISCNPLVSLPNNAYVREAYEKLEFFCQIDFFLSETARYADVVLAGSLMEEDEGTTTNVEGRVIHHQKAVDPPGDARADWRIICDLAARLGAADKFKYNSPEEIFDELRVASKGGVSDYYGITWDRIDREKGVFWPCPSADHPGTPRLYEGNRFNHPDGKAHFQAVEWKPAAEETDSDYPIILTTGRVVSHYLSGTQTRRIGALVDQYPQPLCEIHPLLAGKLGIAEGDFVNVESRRGSVTVRASVVKTIRPDTVFVPYHWPLDRAANNMTVRAIDPISNIPEYKICAVRVSKVDAPHDAIADLEMEAGGVR
jgi:assimilatory nitrate reductase catalytic subunit